MGRHSAPDDGTGGTGSTGSEPADEPTTGAAVATLSGGRHSRPDDDDEAPGPVLVHEAASATTGPLRPQPGADSPPAGLRLAGPVAEAETAVLGAVAEPEVSAAAPPTVAAVPVTAADAAPGATKQRGATADLALLRAHRGLRAQCAVAVLLPFVAYVVVLLVLGAHGTEWAVWIFAPLIAAGVLFGSLLDLGHRRYGTAQAPVVDAG